MAMASFCEGDKVEVCSKEEGFKGSYYEARVISRFDDKFYKVEYKNLVEEDDNSQPLMEIVPADEIRPLPPGTQHALRLSFLDTVDAFDNDGWWVGKIAGKQGSKYQVYFIYSHQLIAYPESKLRNHLDWIQGKWIFPHEKEKALLI